MKFGRFISLAVVLAVLITGLLPLASLPVQAATTLPTAAQVASQIKVGWNLGNTLEAQCGETAWGNPMVTQQLIDSVKAAGFNAIRIPAAWDCHANQTTLVIDPTWMARVKQVVDYAINDGMYVVLNIHWDDGWLENHVTYADQTAVNTKQNAYWTQIANEFVGYDEHLLFAGTNEVHENYSTPTAENIAVQESYNQTFVNAVRATGGNNASRVLVVQTYNTNIQYGFSYFTMPTDTIANHMIIEVHYYDPYDYTLNSSGPCLAWGTPYTQYADCSWAQESYVDSLFGQVKSTWINAGIPVIMGEYGVAMRPNLDTASRQYYLKYINAAAVNNGVKTFYWDNGVSPTQSGGMALFDRNTGAVVDQGALNAVVQGSVPCASCTGTPTQTPTKTATITMTPCFSCGFKAQYLAGSTTDSTNQLTPHFNIVNNSTSAVPLSDFTIRYWYTDEGGVAQTFSCDYAIVGCSNVAGTFVKLSTPQTGADNYLQVSFSASAGSIPAGGQSGEIQARMNKTDWSNYTQSNDYSFDATKTAFADWNHVTLYRNGDLVWGTEPGMGPTNTPGVTNTPSPTGTVTPSATITPTPTNGPTFTATPSATSTGGLTPTPTRTATRTNTPTVTATSATSTPTRTLTPTLPGPTATPTRTSTVSTGACSPVSSTITAPFTFDGAGTFCWQTSSLGSYINSWNLASLTINGVNATNTYLAAGSYPPAINGFWYISYTGSFAWSHFETK